MSNRTHKCLGQSDCCACTLRGSMVCSGVGPKDLPAFRSRIDNLIYEPGAILYQMAEPAQSIYCVRHGAIKLVRLDAAGHERIVRILKAHDIAGLESLLSGKHQHVAMAVTEVHACRVPVTHFREFLTLHPNLQMRLLEKSQEALLEVDQWLSDLVSNSIPARIRLARFLLRMRIGDSEHIHRLSLADTGAILGLAPETLCRILRQLMKEGILSRVGKGMGTRHYRGDISALQLISEQA